MRPPRRASGTVTTNRNSNDVSILLSDADDAALFYLDTPARVTAALAFDLTVYALSGTFELPHGYRGTVAFWSTDKAATLPEPYRFQPEDWGIASFPGGVTRRTPGLQELYAFDLETFTVIGYAAINVLNLGGMPGSGGEPGLRFDLFVMDDLGPVQTVEQDVRA